MRIELLFMGKIKNSFIKEGVQEYLKRMNTKGWKVTLRENVKNGDRASVILTERGQDSDTEKLFSIFDRGISGETLRFLIGPPDGFKELPGDIPAISLSKLTMTSELTALMFLEQLYRFHAVSKGKRYVR